MKTSPAGLALIKEFEGCRLTAYKCPAGVLTIGYGHTSAAGSPPVTSGQRITQAEADAILIRDLAKYEAPVLRLVKVPMTQGQFDALVSLCYNIGAGNLAKSSVVRLLNAGDVRGATGAFAAWNKGGGKVLPGLVRRRKAEAALFAKPAPAYAPSSTRNPGSSPAKATTSAPKSENLPASAPVSISAPSIEVAKVNTPAPAKPGLLTRLFGRKVA